MRINYKFCVSGADYSTCLSVDSRMVSRQPSETLCTGKKTGGINPSPASGRFRHDKVRNPLPDTAKRKEKKKEKAGKHTRTDTM